MRRYLKFITLATLLLAAAMSVAQAQVQPDSNMLMPEVTGEWKTLETPHFRIHHESAHKEYAQNMAAIAERVHGRLSAWLAWQPLAPTEVVLLDTIDASNGMASPLPYNRISIYMQTPANGELMDQTPWLEMVFTHEYVHILHLDMVYGPPEMVRNIFGRSMDLLTLFSFPQLFAPTWVSEGIAVYGESNFLGGNGHAEAKGTPANYGRLNGAYYEGLMRMEVQRGLYTLNEVSFNSGFRWPYGQVYLYGAYFFKFAEARYGRDAVTDYIRLYGRNLIPFRMDKRAKLVFDKPAQEVWAEFQDYLTRQFAPQLASIAQQNRFVTRTVYDAPYSNSALAASASGDLYFLHDDASSRPEIRRLRADGADEAVLDGRGVQDIDWHEGSGLLLSKFAVCDNTNVYADLYRWQQGMAAAKRLTHCGRYSFAAWSPDGLSIAAIKSERGLSSLYLLDGEGKIISVLADLPSGDSLGHIAWSPDAASVVASIHRQKTGWNLELLDVKTHLWRALTSGNDMVRRPKFSRDGSEIFFLSDHGRVWNLRRLKLGSKDIDTLSNSASIISEAVVMTDKSFRLVEHTPNGKVIVALESAPAQGGLSYAASNTPPPAVDAIVNAADYQAYSYAGVKAYSPWNTLRPHSWFPLLDTGAGKASYAGVIVYGSDALDFHRWSMMPLFYYEQGKPGGLANYSFYNKLTLSAQRQYLLQGDEDAAVRYLDEEMRYQALLHHSFNTLDTSLYFAAGVASEEINSLLYKGAGADQRYNNKITGSIAQYDSSRLYKRSVAAVEGRRVQLLGETYDLLGGSDFSGKTSRIDWHEYFSLGDSHALHLRLLAAAGDPGIRPYQMGGASEMLSQIGGETGLGRRDFPLRGYASGLAGLSGSNMGLFSAEWDIPLGYHYDGWFVPPLGIGRESLTLFVDSGDAWNKGETIAARTGAGVEWNVEALLGYDLLKLATTLGYAHGFDKGGEDRLYLRVTLPLL